VGVLLDRVGGFDGSKLLTEDLAVCKFSYYLCTVKTGTADYVGEIFPAQ
jgi:hypothetical protein